MHRDPDPTTAEKLLEHAATLRAIARAVLHEEAAAEDAVQETYLRALERPPSRGSLGGWLAAVVRNLSLNSRRGAERRHRRETGAAAPERGPSTVDTVVRIETHRRIADAVMALPEPGRSTVVARYFEGLRPGEIARREGIPEDTVRSRLRRALERLRVALDDDPGRSRRAWALVLVSGRPAALGRFIGGVTLMTKAKTMAFGVLLLVLIVAGVGFWGARDAERAPVSPAVAPPAARGDTAAQVRAPVATPTPPAGPTAPADPSAGTSRAILSGIWADDAGASRLAHVLSPGGVPPDGREGDLLGFVRGTDGSRIRMLDATSGQLRWELPALAAAPRRMTPEAPFGPCRFSWSGGKLLELGAHSLRAIDPANAHVDWQRDLEELPGFLQVAGDRSYLVTGPEQGNWRKYALTALDSTTGRKVWTSSYDVSGCPDILHVDDRTIVLANNGMNDLLVFDAGTGELRWQTELGPNKARGLWVVGNRVVVRQTPRRLHALDLETGEDTWTTELPSPQALPYWEPVIQDGRMLLILEGAGLAMLNASDGKLDWCIAGDGKAKLDRGNIYTLDTSCPLVDGDRILLLLERDGALLLASRDRRNGEIQWETPLSIPPGTPVSVATTTRHVAIAVTPEGNEATHVLMLAKDRGEIVQDCTLPDLPGQTGRYVAPARLHVEDDVLTVTRGSRISALKIDDL